MQWWIRLTGSLFIFEGAHLASRGIIIFMETSGLAGKQKGHILECNDNFFLSSAQGYHSLAWK